MPRRKTLGILTALLILTLLSGLLLLYRIYQNKGYLDILSGVNNESPNEDAPPLPEPEDVENQIPPDSLEPITDLNNNEVLAVSTGNFYNSEVRSKTTGEVLGDATILEFVTKDYAGRDLTLPVVIQVFLKSNPDNDLIPWVASLASFTKSGGTENYQEDPKTSSLEDLSRVFSKNSVWILTPLVDFDADEGLFSRYNQGYVFFARQYYGEDLSAAKEFVGRGFIVKGVFDRPLLLMTIEWLK